MATSRPRHLITETDEVARALADAAREWPQERSKSRLLMLLAEKGHRVLLRERRRASAEREASVRRTSGMLTGVFGPDYLETLRHEWPE